MSRTLTPALPRAEPTPWVVPVLLSIFAAAMIWFGWVGYYGSDDQTYADAGLGWLNDFPYVGDSHWSLRHTIVVPIAVSFGLFGVGEFTLVLSNLLYFAALLALSYRILDRYFDRTTAAIGVVLLATTPLMAVQASVVMPDFAEVFFALLSMYLFSEAVGSDRPHRLLLLAGAAAGLGWLTRETVAFFLFTYFVLFLWGYGLPRRLYLVMAVPFFAIAGLEFLYFWIAAHDPLHRIVTDLHTHLGASFEGKSDGGSALLSRLEHAATRTEGDAYGGGVSRTGNLSVGRVFDPILTVLANQEFMFLYYLAVPVAAWVITAYRRRATPERRRFVTLFGLTAGVWFVFLYLQIGMTLLPRYYMLPTVVLIFFLAVWLRESLWERHRRLALLIVGGLVLTNLAGIYVENRDPIFAERALAAFAKTTGEPIRTDPETARRGGFLYRLAGVEERIVAAEPKPGVLFFANPKYVVWGEMSGFGGPESLRQRLAPYRPQPGWQEIRRWESPRKLFGLAIEALDMKKHVPASIFRRLDKPNPDVAVYRP